MVTLKCHTDDPFPVNLLHLKCHIATPTEWAKPIFAAALVLSREI
ncbi:MAG TPA: hypothetical protein PKX00_06230 [Opitutaceae bacterium]|nr:hypothetical protein [Opitutaceae bacterium]